MKLTTLLAMLLLIVCHRQTLETGQQVRQRETTLTGPLVGSVTDKTAQIWAYVGKEPALQVRYQTNGAGPISTQPMSAPQADNYAARAMLSGLQANTRYTYEIWSDAKLGAGEFKTAPTPGASGRVVFAVTSCMKLGDNKQDLDETGFRRIAARDPTFLLLIGDNVYADTTCHDAIWEAHLKQRAVKEFKAAVAKTAVFAVWDDHDYAGDGTGKMANGKENSLKAFKELFPNPAFGLADEEGVFFRFSWGDIDIFMLDVRYERDPNCMDPSNSAKTILGPKQFAWLEAGLKASTAKFKIIASGSPWTSVRRGEVNTDDWSSFPYSQKRLLDYLKASKISGVVLLTGDRHRCEVIRHAEVPVGHPYKSGLESQDDGVLPYPLYEVVSSGIAKYKNHHEPKRDAVYGGFALITADTALADPTLTVELIDNKDAVAWKQVISLSELHP